MPMTTELSSARTRRHREKGPIVNLLLLPIAIFFILKRSSGVIMTTTGMTAATKLSVRVVSYNVLSSHLASPTHFNKCNPDHLEAENRLPKILNKFQEEMSTSQSPIFCLQEVSQMWAGKFHVFFAKHNYQMITGLYGRRFNGYMGIAIAYPAQLYDVLDVDIVRLSDAREGGWPQQPPEEAKQGIATIIKKATEYSNRIIKTFFSSIVTALDRKLIGYSSEDKKNKQAPTTIDHWEYSENRQNILIFVMLREKSTNKDSSSTSPTPFCVANYHMPCAFFAPKVMTIHAEMAAKRTQILADKHPYILAGDFNILKQSSTYRLLTTGLPPDDDTFPTPKYGMEWRATILPMRSAYAQHSHGEPDFTNYAHTCSMNEPFIETLDYIFLSDHWHVKDVKSIRHRRDVINDSSNLYIYSFPNQDEPSDHVLIAATVELGPESTTDHPGGGGITAALS